MHPYWELTLGLEQLCLSLVALMYGFHPGLNCYYCHQHKSRFYEVFIMKKIWRKIKLPKPILAIVSTLNPQKTKVVLFSRGIIWEHWPEIGQVALNLKKKKCRGLSHANLKFFVNKNILFCNPLQSTFYSDKLHDLTVTISRC